MKRQGISLIVLVITIIVMIILAAAIIISLNNTGIIGNANKAKDTTNLANIKTAADLEYSEYILDKSILPEGTTIGDYITDKLVQKGTIKGKDKDYYIVVNNEQTHVVTVGSTADKYIKGEIKDGDYVDYDPKAGVIDTSNITYTGKWQVVGLTDDCCLKLISAESVGTYKLISDTTGEEILKAITQIKEICSAYGKGTGAKYSRSIEIEDFIKECVKVKYTIYWQKEGEDVKLVLEQDNLSEKKEFLDNNSSKFSYLQDGKVYESLKPTNLKDGERKDIITSYKIGNIVKDENKMNLILKDVNGNQDTKRYVFLNVVQSYSSNSFIGYGLLNKNESNIFRVDVMLIYGKGDNYKGGDLLVNLRVITILDENINLQKIGDNSFSIEK